MKNIKLGKTFVLLESNNWEMQTLWELKNWNFKINQESKNIFYDNKNAVRTDTSSAEISWNITNIDLDILKSLTKNCIEEEWKYLYHSGSTISKWKKIKIQNIDNENKAFCIEMKNSYMENPLSINFNNSPESPVFTMDCYFIWMPDENWRIFEIYDNQKKTS